MERGRFSRSILVVSAALLPAAALSAGFLATTVPNEIQQPGTQPGEVSGLERADKCDNCHGGYDPAAEPWHPWQGSMMGNALRDPIFWATVAVAEQDFDGAGDLCLRCHSPGGWLEGRSTPTDGSALAAQDADAVTCDLCHKMVDPDDSEHIGEQNWPFLANDGGAPPQAYLGSGMYVLWGGAEKLGPYASTVARHQFLPSEFHRSADQCGTCHDVSNPLVGDLAHNNGSLDPLPPGSFSGVPGDPVETKAAFNNFPFAYGVVERTFSEHQASAFATLRVSDYGSLPADLQDGSIEDARQAALVAGRGGDYEDGTARFFTCQSCHMKPVTGVGCNKSGAPVRKDLPHHDLTGGNAWMSSAIQYLDGMGRLVSGGGLTAAQRAALDEGALRAQAMLESAAGLEVQGDTVRVVNLTGHKLQTGFPEGRRMWLRVQWRDGAGQLVREDGAYDWITVTHRGQPLQVRSLVDLHDPETRVYEAHFGITQEWAAQLIGIGLPAGLPLLYDRTDGSVAVTLGDVAALPAGSAEESLHFVLNNTVLTDNRIPPYGFAYDEARRRNALPVPETLYGDPGAGGTFDYWDELSLDPPPAAVSATIELLYQSTSWEYIQFLDLANTGQVAFLATTGADMLEAWLQTGMAEPLVMASAAWNGGGPITDTIVLTGPTAATTGQRVDYSFTNAPPSSPYALLYGFSAAGSTIFGHPFDIGAPWTPLYGTTDPAGAGALGATLPGSLAGRTLYLEIGARDASTSVISDSNLITLIVS